MINSGLMRSFVLLASAIFVLSAATAPATASSSDWHDSEGGKVRLVTTGKPDAQGKLLGALEIALKPGWKTYWRDPGDSGVPPQIGVERSSNVAKAVLAYPAPQRHDDGYSKWAGYDYPVTLPVSFTVPSPGEPVKIEADVLLGICETICIPVQAKFTIDPATDSDDQADATVVKAALSALPAAAQADFGINVLPGDQETLVVEAKVPGNGTASDFFVAGEQGYMFGTPVKAMKSGKTVFTVPILDRPSEVPTGEGLFYTLTDGGSSVFGMLRYP
jgi:DsbC/DsbD-like thiol-disulfide interchange protein